MSFKHTYICLVFTLQSKVFIFQARKQVNFHKIFWGAPRQDQNITTAFLFSSTSWKNFEYFNFLVLQVSIPSQNWFLHTETVQIWKLFGAKFFWLISCFTVKIVLFSRENKLNFAKFSGASRQNQNISISFLICTFFNTVHSGTWRRNFFYRFA